LRFLRGTFKPGLFKSVYGIEILNTPTYRLVGLKKTRLALMIANDAAGGYLSALGHGEHGIRVKGPLRPQ